MLVSMGILGFSAELQNMTTPYYDKFYYIDMCTHCLYHGADWIYAFIDSISVYDVKLWYFWFMHNIYNDCFSGFIVNNWNNQIIVQNSQLYKALTLDVIFLHIPSKLPYDDEWFRSYLASVDLSSTLYYYPELRSVFESNGLEYYFPVISNLKYAIGYLLDSENLLTAIMLFPQYLMCLFLIGLSFMLWFNFYTSSTKEESIIDQDFLIFGAIVDGEEEIGSVDDILFGFLIFFYIFGWFFYVYVWSLLVLVPELLLVFWLVPFVYVVILLIPASLLYDFGIYFLGYLRGVSATPVFLAEALFDYIAVFAFFIRLVVQGVRILLMFFVYASFHDLIVYWSWDTRWFYSHERLWKDIYSLELTVSGLTYYFFFKTPTIIVYLIYELLHTFFVVTAQFFAFIGMVFWLFFFLYTFFVFEPQESYLTFKRNTAKVKKFFHIDIK